MAIAIDFSSLTNNSDTITTVGANEARMWPTTPATHSASTRFAPPGPDSPPPTSSSSSPTSRPANTQWKKLEVVTIEVRVQRTATKRNSRMTQSFVSAGAGGGTGRGSVAYKTRSSSRPRGRQRRRRNRSHTVGRHFMSLVRATNCRSFMDTRRVRGREGGEEDTGGENGGRKRIGRKEMHTKNELYTAAKSHFPATGCRRRLPPEDGDGGRDMMARGRSVKPKGVVKITLRGHFSFLGGGGGE